MSETKSSGKRLSAEDVKGKFQEDLAFADYCHLPAAQWPPSREGLKRAASWPKPSVEDSIKVRDAIREIMANVTEKDWDGLPCGEEVNAFIDGLGGEHSN